MPRYEDNIYELAIDLTQLLSIPVSNHESHTALYCVVWFVLLQLCPASNFLKRRGFHNMTHAYLKGSI